MNKAAIVTMFKDEEDFMERWCKHYIRLGFENFFLVDNNSTDRSKEIAYDWLGHRIKHYHNEPSVRYAQHINSNVISQHAYGKGMRWIVPADIDELLHGDLDRVMLQPVGWVPVKTVNHKPDGTPYFHDHNKVILNYIPSMTISIGQHQLDNAGGFKKLDGYDLTYHHYPYRSYEQMKKKLTNLGKAFEGLGMDDNRRYQDWLQIKERGEKFFEERWLNLQTDKPIL